MTDMEKAKFTAAVAGLASFYGVELSHMALGIYWDTLREHDLKTVAGGHAVPRQGPRAWPLDAQAGRHHPPPARPDPDYGR